MFSPDQLEETRNWTLPQQKAWASSQTFSPETITQIRQHAPHLLTLREVLVRASVWCQPEIRAFNRQVRLSRYRDWFCADSVIPDSFDFTLTENPVFSSLTGEVQSGKTSIALRLAHKSIISGVPVIYLILARKAGHRQLEQRLVDLNTQFQDWCQQRNLLANPISYVFASDSRISTQKKVESLFHNPGLIVVYGNVAQIRRVLSYRKGRYNLLIDEVDEQEKKVTTSVYLPYDELVRGAHHVIGITATSFKYWYANGLVENIRCFILERHRDYRGIDQISLDQPIDEKIFLAKGEDPFHKSDFQFEGYLRHLEDCPGFDYYDPIMEINHHQPVICLYRVSDTNRYHTEVFNYMRRYNRMKWCVIQFDGEEGANIKLYHSDIVTREDRVRIGDTVYSPNNEGVYYISRSSISGVLGFLRDLMTRNQSFKNILIVTGKLASRQISYVCDRYIWHLSHMRLLRSASSNDCTELIQQMRLCGIYKYDDVPLHLSVKTKEFENLLKAYHLQQEMIRQAKQQDPTKMFDLLFRAEKSLISFSEEQIPEMKLDKRIPKKALHVEKEKKEEGGPAMIGQILNAYHKGNTLISDIIRLFQKESYRALTPKQILSGITRPICNLSNYTQYDPGHNKYIVLVPAGSGTYNLNPDVVAKLLD